MKDYLRINIKLLYITHTMIIPVRCFSCNHVLADKWVYFEEQCKEIEKNKDKKENIKYFDPYFKKEILDKLGLKRYCCRRHFLGNVDLIDII